jgi:hypothetical protein
MIEAVARALFDHEWKGQPGLENEWRKSREYWLDAARVAVRAMDPRCFPSPLGVGPCPRCGEYPDHASDCEFPLRSMTAQNTLETPL